MGDCSSRSAGRPGGRTSSAEFSPTELRRRAPAQLCRGALSVRGLRRPRAGRGKVGGAARCSNPGTQAGHPSGPVAEDVPDTFSRAGQTKPPGAVLRAGGRGLRGLGGGSAAALSPGARFQGYLPAPTAPSPSFGKETVPVDPRGALEPGSTGTPRRGYQLALFSPGRLRPVSR